MPNTPDPVQTTVEEQIEQTLSLQERLDERISDAARTLEYVQSVRDLAPENLASIGGQMQALAYRAHQAETLVLVMLVHKGKSYAEIGRDLGVTRQAVAERYARASADFLEEAVQLEARD